MIDGTEGTWYTVGKIARLKSNAELEDLTHKDLGELLENYKLKCLTPLDNAVFATYWEKNGNSILIVTLIKSSIG